MHQIQRGGVYVTTPTVCNLTNPWNTHYPKGYPSDIRGVQQRIAAWNAMEVALSETNGWGIVAAHSLLPPLCDRPKANVRDGVHMPPHIYQQLALQIVHGMAFTHSVRHAQPQASHLSPRAVQPLRNSSEAAVPHRASENPKPQFLKTRFSMNDERLD